MCARSSNTTPRLLAQIKQGSRPSATRHSDPSTSLHGKLDPDRVRKDGAFAGFSCSRTKNMRIWMAWLILLYCLYHFILLFYVHWRENGKGSGRGRSTNQQCSVHSSKPQEFQEIWKALSYWLGTFSGKVWGWREVFCFPRYFPWKYTKVWKSLEKGLITSRTSSQTQSEFT